MSIKQLKGSFTYFDAEDGKYVTANYDDPNVGPITTLQEVERKRKKNLKDKGFTEESYRDKSWEGYERTYSGWDDNEELDDDN